ncbi:hypothetical protein EC973_008570 [Apophysomyces ossiformis]|uniref:CREG-like beta-barrel domain-containing protein n=1 Tax=Apophysomyces ossiformis TaxID=679940 RepID=A0A8H7BTH2_9FUNG|nr:hypothetical protein EC973_008570 [Apophysomyces ossiformis]
MNIRNLHNGPNRVSFSVRALKDYNPKVHNRTSRIEQPRFTLLGEVEPVPHHKREESLSCYLPIHPEMKPMVHFKDFNPYIFRVKSIYYIGGFGGLNYIGWIPLPIYQQAHKVDELMFKQQ